MRVISLHRVVTRRWMLPLGYWSWLSALTERLMPGKELLVPVITWQVEKRRPTSANQWNVTVALTPWSLGPATLDRVWGRLVQSHPLTIVEFGSGASTVILAAYCQVAAADGASKAHVFSV